MPPNINTKAKHFTPKNVKENIESFRINEYKIDLMLKVLTS